MRTYGHGDDGALTTRNAVQMGQAAGATWTGQRSATSTSNRRRRGWRVHACQSGPLDEAPTGSQPARYGPHRRGQPDPLTSNRMHHRPGGVLGPRLEPRHPRYQPGTATMAAALHPHTLPPRRLTSTTSPSASRARRQDLTGGMATSSPPSPLQSGRSTKSEQRRDSVRDTGAGEDEGPTEIAKHEALSRLFCMMMCYL